MTAPDARRGSSAAAAPRRGPFSRLKPWLILGVAALALSAPWWSPRALRKLSFFRIRNVEIVGAQYLTPPEILTRLNVDTLDSVWDDPRPMESRVGRHPQVDSVEITRRMPGTLVVRIVERLPVALVPTAAGLRAVDVRGLSLPIDPTRVNVDLPIVPGRDVPMLGLLYNVRVREPGLFERISEVRRNGPRELVLRFTDGITVRATGDLTATRLADIKLVEQDLVRRQIAAAELDLRYRDQVIARLPATP